MSDAGAHGRLHAIERWTWGLGAVATLLAFCFSRQAGLSVSIGAVLTALNAVAMRRVGERIFSAFRSGQSSLRAVLLFNLKMLGILVVVYFVVTRLHVDPVGLIVGLAAYPIAAVIVALTWVAPVEANPSEVPK